MFLSTYMIYVCGHTHVCRCCPHIWYMCVDKRMFMQVHGHKAVYSDEPHLPWVCVNSTLRLDSAQCHMHPGGFIHV